MSQKDRRSNADRQVECCVCGRNKKDGGVNFFRWPRDSSVLEKWCRFFGVDSFLIAANHESSFICSWHFDSDQFVLIGGRIFWASNAFPKYRLFRPRSSQKAIKEGDRDSSQTKSHAKDRRRKGKTPSTSEISIVFRNSNSKRVGSPRHSVAVIRCVNNPTKYYEFAYNRTSPIDETKFYYCLQCCKAKLQTGIKGPVRTVHLDGSRFLSSGHPFYGHHFACKPLVDKTNTSDKSMTEHANYLKDRVSRLSNANPVQPVLSNDSKSVIEKEFNAHSTDQPIHSVDPMQTECFCNSSCFSTGHFVIQQAPEASFEETVIASPSSDSFTEFGNNHLVSFLSQRDHFINDHPDGHNASDEGDNIAVPPPSQGLSTYTPQLLSFEHLDSLPASCYICGAECAGPREYASHLMDHTENEPHCSVCGQTCPGSMPSLAESQQLTACRSCSQNQPATISNVSYFSSYDDFCSNVECLTEVIINNDDDLCGSSS